MKFSYSAVWDDTVRLIRAHGPLIAAIAGVFIFFPSLLLTYLLPPPEGRPGDANEAIRLTIEYYSAAWPWFAAESLLAMVGTLAVLRLIFARNTTVGAALAVGAAFLPFYFLLSLISGFIIGIGLLFLLLPGFYLAGRLVIAGPVMIAENRRNPIDAIGRAFEITKGRGWAIFFLILLVVVAGFVVIMVVNALLGIVFTVIAGADLGRLLVAIVSAATSTGFTMLLVVLYASIYRSLAGDLGSTAEVFQ